MSNLRDPADWERWGRGSEIQFYATDGDIRSILERGLEDPAAYRLVTMAVTQGPDGRAYERQPIVCPLESIIECASRAGGHQVWLASSTLGHDDLAGLPTVDSWSLTGLIAIQHGLEFRGRRDASRLGMVVSVRNRVTGDVERNQTYQSTYRKLSAEVKGRLRYSSVRLRPDGSSDEDDSLALMTDDAAIAARKAPDRWLALPGRRVTP